MGALIRILFPLIGYFCVASVITLAAGYGYLRHTGALNDENMFRIVSLLHNIDLEEIAAANETDHQDVPPEETSFADRQQHMRMALLHLQAKKDDIEKNITFFKAKANELDTKFRTYEQFSEEVEQTLQKSKDEAMQAGLEGVRAHWKTLDPKKQTKPLLIKMVNGGQMEVVIEILNGMTPKNRTDILKTLDTPDDIDMLAQIQQRMLTGGTKAEYLDEKLQELDQQEN